MSHNPNRGKPKRKSRKVLPKTGYRRNGSTVQRVSVEDIQSKTITGRGWKITHFSGHDFEMVYELFAANGSTGKVVHHELDRTLFVLEGSVFIILDNHAPIEVRKNRSFVIPKGTNYELCTLATADAEIILCQGAGYDETVEVIVSASEAQPISSFPKSSDDTPLRPESRGAAAAAKIKKDRERRNRAKSPVPKKNPDGSPAGHGRTPLAGQIVTGTNPRPIGPGGYAE